MVKQCDADAAQCFVQFQRQRNIGIGGGGAAAGVIVGEDQPAGAALCGDADDVPCIYAYLCGITRTNLGGADTFHTRIQTNDVEFFVFFPFKQGFAVAGGGGGRREDRRILLNAFAVGTEERQDQRNQGSGIVPDAIDGLQFVGCGLQYSVERAEPLEQRMGDGIGIPPRDGKGEQELQHFVWCKRFKTGGFKTRPETLAVSFMLHTGASFR